MRQPKKKIAEKPKPPKLPTLVTLITDISTGLLGRLKPVFRAFERRLAWLEAAESERKATARPAEPSAKYQIEVATEGLEAKIAVARGELAAAQRRIAELEKRFEFVAYPTMRAVARHFVAKPNGDIDVDPMIMKTDW